ncbi:MAG: type II toxin-antitoxin system RelE/ParE family toxin [Methylococcaceae bacterium]|nr:type II toxin-antitoxin system RelE/ParE family toxin [Methylococcaceae bacterium]
MQWTVRLSETALKTLEKINKPEQLRIRQFIKDNLANLDNPRSMGKALQGNLKGLWRYRVGNYRLVCQIYNSELIVMVLEIGHRKDIYK